MEWWGRRGGVVLKGGVGGWCRRVWWNGGIEGVGWC